MALPTTNLTFHADASVDTDLWLNHSPFANHPTDGVATPYWDDVEHADIAASTFSADHPEWRSGTPLMLLPCLDFNGSADVLQLTANNPATVKAMSNVVTNSAFTILASVYVEGITTNAAASYDNDAIFADAGAFLGIHVKNSSDPHFLFWNWDGNEDVVSLPFSLNTSYVLMFRHEGGNLYASLNGGSETSTASGNTTDLTFAPVLGRNYSTAFGNFRMGEIAIWNAALSGSDLTDALDWFTSRWLPAAPGGPAENANDLLMMFR